MQQPVNSAGLPVPSALLSEPASLLITGFCLGLLHTFWRPLGAPRASPSALPGPRSGVTCMQSQGSSTLCVVPKTPEELGRFPSFYKSEEGVSGLGNRALCHTAYPGTLSSPQDVVNLPPCRASCPFPMVTAPHRERGASQSTSASA